MENFGITAYSHKYRKQIINTWKKSVLATHNFLKQEDFKEIKSIVQKIDFNALDVYLLKRGDSVAGFIGISEKKI